MITNFKLFEKAFVLMNKNGEIEFKFADGDHLYNASNIDKLPDKYNKILHSLKFEIGEPVRIKNLLKDGINLIFFIDGITLGDEINHQHLYHINDDKYIYQGNYKQFELVKISDEEKIALKYNI